MIEEATKSPDLSHFTIAALKLVLFSLYRRSESRFSAVYTSTAIAHVNRPYRNPSHTSHTDLRPHATALLATELQAAQKKSHVVHIYHDENGNYTGHTLYSERNNTAND